jgi:hypothetical protein
VTGPSNQVNLATEVANQARVAGGDIADELANFLIARAPELAKEFAACHPVAAEPATSLPAWMHDIATGEILTTNDAMVVCSVTTPDAIRARCKRAEEDGFPVAVCLGGAYLISLRLLLSDVERTKGLPARLAAESAAKKLPKFGSNQIIRSKSDGNLA